MPTAIAMFQPHHMVVVSCPCRWKEWEVWDARRYEHQWNIYEKRQSRKSSKKAKRDPPPLKDGVKDDLMVSKKKSPPKGGDFSIPKKKSNILHLVHNKDPA